jgi:ABC-type transport system involved in cytochrome c biogenesis permease subunit
MDLDGFGRLPAYNGGRAKPLDTVARNSLMVISGGRTTFTDLDGSQQPAIRWLLDVMTVQGNGRALKQKVFRIENDQLLDMLKLERRVGSYRYSFAELGPSLKKLTEQADRARERDATKRDTYQVKVLELAEHLQLFVSLARMEDPLLVPIPNATDVSGFAILPEATQKSPKDPAVLAMFDMLEAYSKEDATAFNQALAGYTGIIEKRVPSDQVGRVSFETTFNEANPFWKCMYLYFTVFLLTCAGWALWNADGKSFSLSTFLLQFALALAVGTALVHTFGLLSRMMIQDRYAPVTNLYSSAVFIGWGCVLLGIGIECFLGRGIGNAVAAVAGGFTLILANLYLSQDGDTLEMMQAVLDTTFWLATHVVCVTCGYTATFVAGLLGIFYILWGMGTPYMTRQLARGLWEVMYAVVCFAMLLSFVGTVLGGIWADQSWGRFWGWDPKENGAVLIVIWNALILHARWGGMVKERGMAVLAVAGNMIVAWSYFGTNQLGVGLHAYGFSNALAVLLVVLWTFHLIIIGVGLVPLKYWWSFQVPSVIEVGESNPLADADPAPKDGIQPRPRRRPRLA